MTWRAQAAPIIARVIREVGKSDPKALRKALREAYPFGQREMWPYKVWLDEIHQQLGTKKSPARKRLEQAEVAMEYQTSLF